MGEPVCLRIDAEGIAHLQLLDDDAGNLLSPAFVAAFGGALDQLQTDGHIRVCVLSGGSEVFCGGADRETLLRVCDGATSVSELQLPERLLDTPVPIIAAMEGHAVGGGLALAAACDLVVAARESRYGAVFMNMGFTPGMGATVLLPEFLGPYVADEAMYTGKLYRGAELARKGTRINAIVPRADVMSTAMELAQRIAEKGTQSIRLLKTALAARRRQMLGVAREQEDVMHRVCFALPETRRAIEAEYAA